MPPKKKKAKPKSRITRSRASAKRLQWSNESMEAAMKTVRTGATSINKAAVLHGVPASTLKDRMSGRVKHGTKSGPKRYLVKSEEQALADHLIEAASIGYGKTRREVKMITEKVAKEKNLLRKERVTDGWWRRFMERQPELSLRRGDPTAHVRMDATNKATIDAYYDLLHETLEAHKLLDNPAQIYNIDESGMPLDPRPPKHHSQKRAKEGALQSIREKRADNYTRLCKCSWPSTSSYGYF
jgi:hypothetical protein